MAATSPLALASVLVVLTGADARLKGAAFAIGFVAGQATFFLIALEIGSASSPDGRNHPALVAVIETLFGAALLVTAAYVHRHRGEPRPTTPNPRTEAFRARLANLRPSTALGTGTALGIGGPKRISISLLVSAAIASSGVGSAATLGLAVLYIAVATILVWVPVLLFILLGQRATDWLAQGQHWIGQHRDPLTFWPSAVLGVFLVVGGIVQLVG